MNFWDVLILGLIFLWTVEAIVIHVVKEIKRAGK